MAVKEKNTMHLKIVANVEMLKPVQQPHILPLTVMHQTTNANALKLLTPVDMIVKVAYKVCANVALERRVIQLIPTVISSPINV